MELGTCTGADRRSVKINSDDRPDVIRNKMETIKDVSAELGKKPSNSIQDGLDDFRSMAACKKAWLAGADLLPEFQEPKPTVSDPRVTIIVIINP